MSGSVAQCCPLVYTSWIVNLQKILGNKIYFTTAPSVNRCFNKVGNTGDRHKHLSSSCAQGFTDDRQKSSLFFAPWRMRLITNTCGQHMGLGVIAAFGFVGEEGPRGRALVVFVNKTRRLVLSLAC